MGRLLFFLHASYRGTTHNHANTAYTFQYYSNILLGVYIFCTLREVIKKLYAMADDLIAVSGPSGILEKRP